MTIYFSHAETLIIDAEITKLSGKEVIERMRLVPDGFPSNIFMCPKKDGTSRMILNLKPLNEFFDLSSIILKWTLSIQPQANPTWILYGICRS